MKKIAYIELDTHAEIASNFMNLLQGSQTFSADYYFSSKILKHLGLSAGENIFQTDAKNIIKQISAKNYDLVIIGTVHRYFNVFFKITEKFNTSVIVHNLNFSKARKSILFQNIFKKDTLYRLKLFLKEGLLAAPEVYRTAKNQLVLDESLVNFNHALNHSNTSFLKYLPVFYTQSSEKADNEKLTVVIPGAVSQQRRNYLHVLANLEYFLSPVLVIFLGKAQNTELGWLQKFEKTKKQNVEIQYFTEKVPQKIFDELIQKADVLWCPIQEESEFFSQKEIYGKTKMSGNVGDAIKYSKPAVFNPHYDSGLNFILKKNNPRLEEFFTEIKNRNFDFSDYQMEKVRADLHKVLYKLL